MSTFFDGWASLLQKTTGILLEVIPASLFGMRYADIKLGESHGLRSYTTDVAKSWIATVTGRELRGPPMKAELSQSRFQRGTEGGIHSSHLVKSKSSPLGSVVDRLEFFSPRRLARLLFHHEAGRGLSVSSAGCSEKGEVRKRNEDRWYTDTSNRLLLVADGMGGYFGGEKASDIVTSKTCECLLPILRDKEVDGEMVANCLCQCVSQSHKELVDFSFDHPQYRNMGSTLAVTLIKGNDMWVASVGDSRVYLMRGGRLTRLTKDETLVQALLDAGVINKKEAKTHVARHVLLNSISTKSCECELQPTKIRLAPGDQILLATDGLTDALKDDVIARVFKENHTPKQCVESLVSLALENGANDNVTAIVAYVGK